jgi:alpha-tubulin suppressor-like RCC1 family protein
VSSAATNVVAWGAGKIIKLSDNNDYGQAMVPANLTNATFLAGGWRHSLALRGTNALIAWGDSTLGQTNLPTTNSYVALACGDLFSIGLKTDGTLAETGDDYYGQIEVPQGLSNVVAIACGAYHGLALKADGTVKAWSTNGADLGTQNFLQTRVPVNLSNVVAIAAGGWHSIALKSDGSLVAWGRNDYGQGSIPIGISNIVAISAGVAHNLVLKNDGTVFAWGLNTYGQTDIPPGLSNVVAIASGGWHNLVLKSDGTVVAWGAGSGSNTNVDYGQNTPPPNLTNVVQVAAGKVHSLALIGTGLPVTQVMLTNFNFSTNGFTVSVPTLNGRVYRLEYKNSLADSNWTALPLEAGGGGILQLSAPGVSAPQRFYRVRQW